MRAVAGSIDQISPGQKRLDFPGGERVAGFHGGLAGHHVEDLVQQFFLVQIEQFLFAALQ